MPTKIFISSITQTVCPTCDGTYICPECDGYNEGPRARKSSFFNTSACANCDYGACPECEKLNEHGKLEAVPISLVYGNDRSSWPSKIRDYADGEYTMHH